MTARDLISGADVMSIENEPVDRVISLGTGLPAVPERLLLAHARGQVLFIAGAGISRPASLPDFRKLVVDVYERLDMAVHERIKDLKWGEKPDVAGLSHRQIAEVKRYELGEYDVVLGMLERRMDREAGSASKVRRAVAEVLRAPAARPAPIHRALMRLADRGSATAIVTTNFDLLLQGAVGKNVRPKPMTYSLGAIPRPGRNKEFAGVLHIHGALDANVNRFSDLVVTDQDFGEFYLRRRTVPDFIYDAARLYHLVLVGYSANDPPMRYLLNAVAADGSRFDDLKERFTFIGTSEPDPIGEEDWRARGITPIGYDSAKGHAALLATLERWATLSAINGSTKAVDAEIKRIIRVPRNASSDADKDLFDHLFRRADNYERTRLSALASKHGADIAWGEAMVAIASERHGEAR